MNILYKYFGEPIARAMGLKSADEPVSTEIQVRENVVPTATSQRYNQILEMMDYIVHPSVCGNNFLALFNSVPEVFWPIDYIAKRISEAHFDLKRVKDDSIVWCNRLNVDSILRQPNPAMSWRELVYQHFVYKLATGNAFMRAAMPDTFGPDTLKCQYCSNYWELPADRVRVIPMQYNFGIPIFGIATIDELIKGYKLDMDPYAIYTIPTHQIWHDRDGVPDMTHDTTFLLAQSRLMSQKKPIANLIATYEARNVIFVKRGALGFIVANKVDESGTVALKPKEKDELLNEFNSKYGLADGKSPYAVTDIPVSFVRTNLSISELQPFDETLADAIQIASVFGIPAVLVPRKDQSTFSNQASAEQSVYTSTIIPAAKRFCEELTQFLGLEKKGYFIDCDFSDVACLQVGRKENEQVKDMVLKRGLMAFNAGLCTLDDIRAQMHEDQKADTIPLFGKLKFEMTPEELEIVNNIYNPQTSKGESNERNEEKPSEGGNEEPPVRNQGS